MAIDPSTTPRPRAGDLPPDENVVSTYRAIAPTAIVSLAFGLASILSFLWPWFAISGALAIVFGALALRAIHRLPEALTGARMANVGMGMGLLFSLAALTIGATQMWIIDREATRFARTYVEALERGSLEDAMFLHSSAEGRRRSTPRESLDELRKGAGKPGMFEMETGNVTGMINRLKSTPDQKVELVKILNHQVVGMDAYVEFLFKFRGPKSQEFPAETDYGVVQVIGVPEGRVYGWKVQTDRFPAPPPPGGF